MIAVVGAAGQLGDAFMRLLGDRAVGLTRADVDLARVDDVEPAIAEVAPHLVLNCAAYNAVDRAEDEPDVARAVNELAVEALARAARRRGAGFVTFSTDYVFDGERREPYVESSEPNPLGVYGASKLAGELRALATHPDALVVRTSWVLSALDRNFATRMVGLARRGPVRGATDQVGRPTMVDDLAPAVLAAVEAGATGLLHLSNRGTVNRFELARAAVAAAGLDPELVTPARSSDFPSAARRPAYSVLESERLAEWGLEPLPDFRPGLEKAMAAFAAAG